MLSRLSPRPKEEVNRVINRLESGPDRRHDLPLQEQRNLYRARAGRRWRVIFAVEPGHHIQVKRISRRRDAYEGIEHPDYRDVRELGSAYVAEEESVSAATAD